MGQAEISSNQTSSVGTSNQQTNESSYGTNRKSGRFFIRGHARTVRILIQRLRSNLPGFSLRPRKSASEKFDARVTVNALRPHETERGKGSSPKSVWEESSSGDGAINEPVRKEKKRRGAICNDLDLEKQLRKEYYQNLLNASKIPSAVIIKNDPMWLLPKFYDGALEASCVNITDMMRIITKNKGTYKYTEEQQKALDNIFISHFQNKDENQFSSETLAAVARFTFHVQQYEILLNIEKKLTEEETKPIKIETQETNRNNITTMMSSVKECMEIAREKLRIHIAEEDFLLAMEIFNPKNHSTKQEASANFSD